MGRGKKYQPEQVGGKSVASDRSGSREQEEDDTPAGMQGCRDRGADLLPLAQGVRRSAGGPGEAA